MNTLDHAAVQELLGAYALGAVDATEAAIVAAHLPTCRPCRDEVAQHRATAEGLQR